MLFAKHHELSVKLTELYKHEAHTRTPSMYHLKEEPIPEVLNQYSALTSKDMHVVDVATAFMTHVLPSNTSTNLLFRLCYMVQSGTVTLSDDGKYVNNGTVFSDIICQHYDSMVCHETMRESTVDVREAIYPLPCTRRPHCKKIHNPFLLCKDFTRHGFCYDTVHRDYTLDGEKPKPKNEDWYRCEHMCMHCEVFHDDAYPPDPDHRWEAKAEYDLKLYVNKIIHMYRVMYCAEDKQGHLPVVNDYLQGIENDVIKRFNISPTNVERLKHAFDLHSLPEPVHVSFRQQFFEPYEFTDFLTNVQPYTLGDDDRLTLRHARKNMADFLGTSEYILPCEAVVAKEYTWHANNCVDMKNITKFMQMACTSGLDLFLAARYNLCTMAVQIKILCKYVMPLITQMPAYLAYVGSAKVMRSFNEIPRGLAHNNQIFWVHGKTVIPSLKDETLWKLRDSCTPEIFHNSIKEEFNHLPDAAFQLLRYNGFKYHTKCVVNVHPGPVCEPETVHVIATHQGVLYKYNTTRQGSYFEDILDSHFTSCFGCIEFLQRRKKPAPSTPTPIPTPTPAALPSSSTCKKERVNITGSSLCAKGNDPFAPKKAKRRNRRK